MGALILTKKQLPEVLRQLVDSNYKSKTTRKFLILAVGQSQAFSDGVCIALPEGHEIERVPYAEGGGYRTTAPAYVIDQFDGGTPTLRIVSSGLGGGIHSFETVGEVAAVVWGHEQAGRLTLKRPALPSPIGVHP